MMDPKKLKTLVKKIRRSMNQVCAGLGMDISIHPPLLEHTTVIKEPAKYAFPKGPVPG